MKQFAIIFFTALLVVLMSACNSDKPLDDVNSNNPVSQDENAFSSLLDANGADLKDVVSEKRINPKLVKHNTILVDAELEYFDSRDEFNENCSDLPVEDFEEGRVPDYYTYGMTGPLNSSTNNSIFSTNEIVDGLEITTINNGGGSVDIAVVGDLSYGTSTINVFANYFVDYLSVKFTNNDVYSVGLDVLTVLGNENLTVEIYGESNQLLETTTAYGTSSGVFWGVTSNMIIKEIRFISYNGNAEGVDNVAFGTCCLEVDIDIKPGSDPNSINCNNDNGVIAVAILSTDDFDATSVDHTTVEFMGATESHVNKKTNEVKRHEEDVNGDGLTDLVLHFKKGDTNLGCNSEWGKLTGETYDGDCIWGKDAVKMVPKN